MIEAILNRLRGTGVIKHFGTIRVGEYSIEVKLVWNHIYALYLGVIIGVIAWTLAGICVAVAYLIGESKGWGEWIGALTTTKIKDEKWLQKQYDDDEGKKFPFIHQISNFFIKEQIVGEIETRLKQYLRYATLALVLRGIYWWLPVYLVMAYFGVISYVEALIIGISLGLCFPIACKLGKLWDYNAKFGVLEFKRGWENQEIVYGLFQGLCLWYVIIIQIAK